MSDDTKRVPWEVRYVNAIGQKQSYIVNAKTADEAMNTLPAAFRDFYAHATKVTK